MTRSLRIAAVGDKLGLARAEYVSADLRRLHPDVPTEILLAGERPGSSPTAGASGPTRPDRDVDERDTAGVEAVRRLLLDERADVAVSAMRDVPLGSAEGIRLAAVPMRADPRDALISSTDKVLSYLPPGTRVGTADPSRRAQLLRRRSDLDVYPIRGSVEERLKRLDHDDLDAIVVSAENLARLGLLDYVTEYFDTDQLIPAPGQATLAVEVRDGDEEARRLVARLNDEPTEYATTAERTCVSRLRPDPGAAIGAFALTDGEIMFIHGIVASEDGSQAARLRWTGPWREAVDVGETLAELLLSAGGREILAGEPIETIYFAKLHRQRIEEDWDRPYPPEEA